MTKLIFFFFPHLLIFSGRKNNFLKKICKPECYFSVQITYFLCLRTWRLLPFILEIQNFLWASFPYDSLLIKLGWYLWLLSKVSNFSDIEKFSYCWIFWSIYSVTYCWLHCVFNLSCLSFRIVFFWYLCVLNLFHKWKYKLGIFYSSLLCFLAPNPLQRKTSVLIAQTSLLLLNCSVFVLV